MNFFQTLSAAIIFGILTGVVHDLAPAMNGTQTALALATGVMGVLTIVNLFAGNFK